MKAIERRYYVQPYAATPDELRDNLTLSVLEGVSRYHAVRHSEDRGNLPIRWEPTDRPPGVISTLPKILVARSIVLTGPEQDALELFVKRMSSQGGNITPGSAYAAQCADDLWDTLQKEETT